MSERAKLILLLVLIGVLALEIAPLIPADRLPQSCLFARAKGEITRWEINRDTTVLRFKHPTQTAVEEWRSSGISDEVIFSNLISVPDYACDPVAGDVVYSIPKILGWNTSKLPREYRPSSFREAWTYTSYDSKTRSGSTTFELKPLPTIRKQPLYRKYESSHDEAPIGYLRTPPSLAAQLLGDSVENKSIDESTKLFWEEVFASNRAVILTEGAKKAASLLSHGHIGISIPGACRAIKFDRSGPIPSALLKPELMPLLKQPRRVYLAFDNDADPRIRNLVNAARVVTARLLKKEGVDVRLIDIPGKEKGVDDFVLAHGREGLRLLIGQARELPLMEEDQSHISELQLLASSNICKPPEGPAFP